MRGDLHTLKRICEYASKVMLAGCIIISLVLIAAMVLVAGSFVSDPMADVLYRVFNIESLDTVESASRMAEMILILILAVITTQSIYRVMVSIRDEHSPFNEGNTSILIRLSKAYLIFPVPFGVLSYLASGILAEALFMFFGCLFVGVVLYCYALIVRYGAVLQDESDHTL